ncbi:PIG-P, partial [Blyttiomyces helicus]
SSRREYYGFILYLSTFVSYVTFLLWAFLPEQILQDLGITYYPTRYWALAVPIWILGLIPFTILMFIGTNLFNTPPLSSPRTLTDRYASMMRARNLGKIINEESIPDLQDVPISMVNQC